MNYCQLTVQETKFLIALLENGPTSKQTSLQLLAAEHLYIPTLLPKLKEYVKRAENVEALEAALRESTKEEFEEYCRAHPEDQSCKEYDV